MTTSPLSQILKPRDYNRTGDVLRHDIAIMLAQHPEAFDCVVYPALESAYNEIEAVNQPNITLLDRDERKQAFGEPILAKAMPIADEAVAMGVVSSGLYEHFESLTTTGAVNLVLSVNAIRSYSLVQWMEYADNDELVERAVYVADTKQCGHTMGVAGVVYVCYPLTSTGDIPAPTVSENEQEPQTEPSIGVL